MRTVTRLQLRTRSSQLANIENDPSFGTTEINDLIDLHMPAVYDILVAAGPADYYAATYAIAVSAGVIPYMLPSNFLSLVNVFVVETTDYQRPIDAMADRERQGYRAPAVACTVNMEYIPVCPLLTSDVSTFDGVDGWDELISARVARDILIKRDGDTSNVLAIMQHAERRIRTYSTQRKRGGPKLLVDVEADVCWPHNIQLDAFRLRGGNLELYSSLWGPYG